MIQKSYECNTIIENGKKKKLIKKTFKKPCGTTLIEEILQEEG